jgi:hypothetical protein
VTFRDPYKQAAICGCLNGTINIGAEHRVPSELKEQVIVRVTTGPATEHANVH